METHKQKRFFLFLKKRNVSYVFYFFRSPIMYRNYEQIMEAERKQMGWETNRKQVDKQWGAFEHQWKTHRKAMRNSWKQIQN